MNQLLLLHIWSGCISQPILPVCAETTLSVLVAICVSEGTNITYVITRVFVAVHCISEMRGFCGSKGAAAQYHCEVFFPRQRFVSFRTSHLLLVYKSQGQNSGSVPGPQSHLSCSNPRSQQLLDSSIINSTRNWTLEKERVRSLLIIWMCLSWYPVLLQIIVAFSWVLQMIIEHFIDQKHFY